MRLRHAPSHGPLCGPPRQGFAERARKGLLSSERGGPPGHGWWLDSRGPVRCPLTLRSPGSRSLTMRPFLTPSRASVSEIGPVLRVPSWPVGVESAFGSRARDPRSPVVPAVRVSPDMVRSRRGLHRAGGSPGQGAGRGEQQGGEGACRGGGPGAGPRDPAWSRKWDQAGGSGRGETGPRPEWAEVVAGEGAGRRRVERWGRPGAGRGTLSSGGGTCWWWFRL